MKLAIRAFALTIVVAGISAASLSPAAKYSAASHQSATAAFPIPQCGPGIPCPPPPQDGGIR